MKKILKKHLTTIVTLIYCIIFSFIFINIAKYHEAWADEAQAWLLARDTNILELIKAMKYEGSPYLWHLILKIAIMYGLSYEKIYFIPLICTIVGIIFLFKNKNVPWIFKLTIPFTYFIFFQYTVVSRSYCLIFPLLMIISNIYDRKEQKLIIYGILLFLLMNVSLHCTLIAGGLWIDFAYDAWKKYKLNTKIEKKEIIFLSVIAVLILTIIIMIFPKIDCTYSPTPNYSFFELLGEIMYTSNQSLVVNIIATIFTFSILVTIFNKENYTKIVAITVPVFLLNLLVTCFPWHVGILYLIILFIIIITKKIKNKLVFTLLLLSILIQIYWTVLSSQYDIQYKYTSGKEVSQYLKQLDYNEIDITAVGFHCVAINAYFENNIFSNYSNSFYDWSAEGAEKTDVNKVLPNIIKNKTDVIIVPDYSTKSTNKLIEAIEKLGYTKKYFEAYMVVKDCLFERTGFYIFEKAGE